MKAAVFVFTCRLLPQASLASKAGPSTNSGHRFDKLSQRTLRTLSLSKGARSARKFRTLSPSKGARSTRKFRTLSPSKGARSARKVCCAGSDNERTALPAIRETHFATNGYEKCRLARRPGGNRFDQRCEKPRHGLQRNARTKPQIPPISSSAVITASSAPHTQYGSHKAAAIWPTSDSIRPCPVRALSVNR